MKIKDAIKDFEKKEHNKKVDKRRKKLKKIGKKGKKIWDYLGKTELAHQSKKSDKSRYGFERRDWW